MKSERTGKFMRTKSFLLKLANVVCICVILVIYQGFVMQRQKKIEAMEEKAGAYAGNDNLQSKSLYEDGTYIGSAQGFGGVIEVEIIIEQGIIVSARTNSADNETPDYFKQAETIFDEVIKKQSAEVDTVTGATYSSNGIINGLKEALEKAKTK